MFDRSKYGELALAKYNLSNEKFAELGRVHEKYRQLEEELVAGLQEMSNEVLTKVLTLLEPSLPKTPDYRNEDLSQLDFWWYSRAEIDGQELAVFPVIKATYYVNNDSLILDSNKSLQLLEGFMHG